MWISVGIEVYIFLAYAAGLLCVYFFGRFLAVPVKIIFRLVLNSLIGGIILLILSEIGNRYGIFVPVNFITAVSVGILGVPCIAAIILFFNLFTVF